MNRSSWRSSATVVVNWAAAVEYDDDVLRPPDPEEDEERLFMLWRLDEFVAFDVDADLLDEWCEDNERNELEGVRGDW